MIARLLTVANETDRELLRIPAKKVRNVRDPEVLIAIQTMKRILLQWEREHRRGAEGLAATQVGIPLRIVVLRSTNETIPPNPGWISLSEATSEEFLVWSVADKTYHEFMHRRSGMFDPFHVVINPQIVEQEGEQESVEGCLSVPNVAATVVRPKSVVFKFMDATGKSSGLRSAEGFSAAAVCHEIDHLNGITLLESAKEIHDLEKATVSF